MRYPLSPQNGEGGRVSSLRSAWEGKSPVNKSRRTVLPSEVRSKEKSRAKQSWRSAAASGQENTTSSSSVPAWRATTDKRTTPVKQQQGWKSSSSSSSSYGVSTSLSPGPRPRLNSPGRIASPGSASKALSAKTNDFIRKWQTIGSPEAEANKTHDVYRSSQKETIGPSGGSSVPKTEVYQSQNQLDSPATLNMTYSIDDSIPPIKMAETADSPSMEKLRSDLDTMSFLDYKKSAPNDEKKYQDSHDEKKYQVPNDDKKYQVSNDEKKYQVSHDEKKYQVSNDEKKYQAVQEEQKQEEEEDEEDEESLYNVDHSVASRSNASSSLVYSLEDTIPSVANSRKSKESLKSVMERLKQTASSASQSSHDGTESERSSGLIASDLVASTLAECRLLLQMSPPPTPLRINVFKEPRKEEETRDEDSDRAIHEALSTDDSAASDNSVSKLMRCPCCSHKFEEAGEHEPLHSFACEHIICRDCVFESTRSKSVPCPECGEEGAFDKSKPLVSRSYLRLIKKMGGSGSAKTKKNSERFKDSPMSVPSQINVGAYGKNANDEISVFSSVSGQIHTAKLANRYRELAKQIDVESVTILSTLSKPHPPPSVKSSFTITPKQDDVLSLMSESQCFQPGNFKPSVYSDNSTVQEAESVMSHAQSNTSSNASMSVKSDHSRGQVDGLHTNLKETSTKPPQEPSTPVSRAEFRFHQRKQRLAESLEKVNKVLAKSKNKNMGRICEEASVASSRSTSAEGSSASIASTRSTSAESSSTSVASSRNTSAESSSASVASSRDALSSVASSRAATSSVASSRAANSSFGSRKQSPTMEPSFTIQDEDMTQSSEDSSKAASATSLNSKEQQERSANAREVKNRFKTQLRVDTGTQPSPLSVHHAQPSPTPLRIAHPIKEETQSEKCSPCESVKSKETVVSDFNPFGDDPFADNVFGGSNVFRGDDDPVVGFGNFIQEASSSSDTEHEGAFLLPDQEDTKYKEQPQPASNELQNFTEANQCAQFLPALDISKNGFISMNSPSTQIEKNKKKKVKKRQQQNSSAKPQKLTQKVFKNFNRSFDEASNTSGLNNTSSGGNQDWRFQEALPKPPSIESSDDEEDEKPHLYEFSEGSCSHSPTDEVNVKTSLNALVTHKKGFRGKIRDKMKKKVGNKKN